MPCSWIGIVKDGNALTLRCFEQATNDTTDVKSEEVKSEKLWLRCIGDYDNNQAQYAYSTDGRCPDALAVDFLVVLQGESIIIKIKTFETVADVFPINKVSGMKNHKSRHSMHRGTCQVVVIAHTEDVRIGELVVEQRVGVRAIAVVSRPRLG